MVYVFLGPAGSGKDTQAKLLATELKLERISTGELFRKEIRERTELGKEVEEVVGAGRPVSDDLARIVLENELKNEKYLNGFIITGYPRTLAQVGIFDEILVDIGTEITKVVHFTLSEEESIKRMQVQASEKGRTDASMEAMKSRYKTMYKDTIDAILSDYKERKLVIEIDATPSVEEIYTQLKQKLGV